MERVEMSNEQQHKRMQDALDPFHEVWPRPGWRHSIHRARQRQRQWQARQRAAAKPAPVSAACVAACF